MTDKMKAVLPLALTIGVLGALYVELTLNFNFHWLSDGDLGNGLSLPNNFHLAAPAGFVSWGFYFAAGAGADGAKKVSWASIIGAAGALLTMWGAGTLAEIPDFWGIAVALGVAAFLVVMVAAAGDWYFLPAAVGAFAATLFWWLATGGDNWNPGGGGEGNSVAALGDPATAGAGAFGGVLSTPYGWVFVNVVVTLILGVVFGLLTSIITSAFTPTVAEAAQEPVASE